MRRNACGKTRTHFVEVGRGVEAVGYDTAGIHTGCDVRGWGQGKAVTGGVGWGLCSQGRTV